MLAKKKKLSKKEIQEDQLVESYAKAIEFFEKFKNQIIIGAIVLAVVIAGGFWYSNAIEASTLEASAKLSKILPYYEKEDYKVAIEGQPGTELVGLKEIAEDYSNVEPGQTAVIYLAHSYYFLNDFDNALKTYKSYSGSVKELQAASLAGMANCYLAKKDYENAADYYKKAAKISDDKVNSPNYLIKAGLALVDANKKDEARKIFESIKKDYKDTPFRFSVEKYLSITD